MLTPNYVTHTKVVLPRRRSDLVSRQRLLDLFYDLLNYKLGLVIAPAGYGKTSLLIDAAYRVEYSVCWYAIDALDIDPQRFAAHFITAIAHVFPDFGQRSMAILQNVSGRINLDQLVTTIVNELYDRVQEHFILVLDDYHLVQTNETISNFINQFVNKSDENCHLVIASRCRVTLPDSILFASRRQMGGIGLNQLAFDVTELQEVALQNYHLTIPQSVAETIVAETEGWITGLLLSMQTTWSDVTNKLQLAQASKSVFLKDRRGFLRDIFKRICLDYDPNL